MFFHAKNNAKEGKKGSPKIKESKTAHIENIIDALKKDHYLSGETITFNLYKKVPELLYLHTTTQGEKQHDKKFLNKEGAYFEVGGGKCPRCGVLTTDELKAVFPSLKNEDIVQEVVNSFNKYCEAFKVNTCTLKAHFFAQAKQESGENLKPAFKGESMNYTVAGLKNTGFMNVSSRHLFGGKTGIQMAEELGRPTSNSPALTLEQQIKVANFVYGLDPKAAALGNKAPANNQSLNENDNEGWRYRGRGMLQITGKENYTKIEKHVNEVLKSNVLNIKDGRKGSKIFTLTEALLSGLGDWHMHKMYVPAEAGVTKEACLGVIKIINSATKSKTKRIAHLIGGNWYENDNERNEAKNIDLKKSMVSIFRVNECENSEEKNINNGDINQYRIDIDLFKYSKIMENNSSKKYQYDVYENNILIKSIDLNKNEHGLLPFPESGSNWGRFGKRDRGGDNWVNEKVCAALLGFFYSLPKNGYTDMLYFNDISANDGRNIGHSGHNIAGNDIDIRYSGSGNGGQTLWRDAMRAYGTETRFIEVLENILTIAFKWGFNKNYAYKSGIKNTTGRSTPIHQDHFHLGLR